MLHALDCCIREYLEKVWKPLNRTTSVCKFQIVCRLVDLQKRTRLSTVMENRVGHVFPASAPPGDYPGFLHLHAKMSCKSPRKHAASYVYMAEVRASILVLVCRIISTLTATGFSNAKFRASCCALALLE
uniref:Uncharacterized protein n=1 Tax=Rhipicephalus microplus TaxID=6941 RepID=A0A6G5AHI6_RHIMP